MENLKFTNQENYICSVRLSVEFDYNGTEYDAWVMANTDGFQDDINIIETETGEDATAFFLYDSENEETYNEIEEELSRILNDVKPNF